MKKGFICMFMLLLSGFGLSAQQKDAPLKQWDNSRLSWDDFQDTTDIKGVSSILKTSLGIEIQKTKEGNIKTICPHAYAAIDRSQSRAVPEEKSDTLLRYYQATFDLLELYKRKLQNGLNKGLTGIDAENEYRHYMQLYNEQCSKMAEETEKGQNQLKMREWELYIIQELRSTPLSAPPTIQPRGFGYGFHLGFGAVFPVNGNLDHYFTPAWQFHLGLDLAYKRAHLLLDMAAGTTRMRKDLPVTYDKGAGQTVWTKRLHPANSQLSATIGYEVLDTRHFSLMPFVGGAQTEYSRVLSQQGLDKINVYTHDFNVTAGIIFDYRFATVVSLVPSFWFGHREMFTSSLRTRLYVNYGNYDFTLKGMQLGFSVSYSGLGRLLKISN
ncbi:MAG: hypothetical protein J1E02_00305 [Coprobacter sp.]|nr:hypothetical protein [Coprobacter sp.]